jgi:cell wall-associated NlpC family hydrolase
MRVVIPLSRKQNFKKSFKTCTLLLCLLLFCFTPVLVSCGSKKPTVVTTKKRESRQRSFDRKARNVSKSVVETAEKMDEENGIAGENFTIDLAIEAAMNYQGTRYKYAGNDERGMDCSGLICTSFREAGKQVPRTSSTLKAATSELKLDDVVKGDLLFFATGRNKNRLNHVALVIDVTPAEIQFIHSSTSRGVIVSSLNEPYWLSAYLSAGRLE